MLKWMKRKNKNKLNYKINFTEIRRIFSHDDTITVSAIYEKKIRIKYSGRIT